MEVLAIVLAIIFVPIILFSYLLLGRITRALERIAAFLEKKQ